MVAEETSRLLDAQQLVAAGVRSIQRRRDSLHAHLDEVVGWQRRTIAAQKASPEQVDSLLGELNRTIELSRTGAERSLSRRVW